MNSTVWPIFNEKIVEICGFINSTQCVLIDWNLFDKLNFTTIVHAQCINNSHNNKIYPKTHEKKKHEPDPNGHQL